MSAATFTPGPWRIRSQAPVGGVYTLTIEQVEGRLIGEVWASHGKAIGDCTPEQMGCANARLIAAAPELLEALRAYASWFDHHPAFFDAITGKMRDVAHLAIAKAEGRKP